MNISPEILEFSENVHMAPFNEQSTKPLTLTNTTNSTLAYKIKTTAPKLYCVRPNASVIDPGATVEVSNVIPSSSVLEPGGVLTVIRQGKDIPNPENKHKDKFLVLSTPVTDVDPQETNFSELWADIEKNRKDAIDNKRIKVTYIYHPPPSPPSEQNEALAAGEKPQHSTHQENGMESHDDFETPVKHQHTASDGAVSANSSSAAGSAIAGGAAAVASGTAANGGAYPRSSTNDSAVQREMNQATEKISSMTKEMKSTAANNLPSKEEVKRAPQQAAQQVRQQPGVPIPAVVALLLVAFIIGKVFF